MRIELIYWKVCKDCEYDVESWDTPVLNDDCKSCNGKGYTEETMEFPEDGDLDVEGKGMFTLRREHWGYKVMYWESGESEDITESLNIQSIHFIEEKECPVPICKDGMCITGELDRPYEEDCTHCNGIGKIEVETSFIVFQSQEEYERELIRLGSKLEHETRYFEKAEKLEKLNSEQETKL